MLQGKITKVVKTEKVKFEDREQTGQILKVKIADGREVEIENGYVPVANPIVYQTNERVMVNDDNGKWQITDYVRTDGILLLTIIFVILTILVSKKRGLGSIISMVLSFGVIVLVTLPLITKGTNPIVATSITTALIIPITFFMSHGFNKKTWVAIAGTTIAMLITSIISMVFVDLTKLSGFSSEESGMLAGIQSNVNMKGILMGGIIIGLLGVLDDITVAQAGIVQQLKMAADKIKMPELYKRAMNVGQDHIASMVNTLILVYAGASLPLLLIFMGNPHPIMELINYEFIAEEVVRTLCGSIGLILAVPITTLIAAVVFENEKQSN